MTAPEEHIDTTAAPRTAAPAGPPYRPFTQEWGDALCAAVNASETYRTTAARWTWPVGLVVQRAPDLGWARDTAVVLSLDHGHCNGAKLVDAHKARAPFLLRATFANWKRVVKGELDPIVGVVKGDIELTGSMATIMMHSRAAKALVDVAKTVPTLFPDER